MIKALKRAICMNVFKNYFIKDIDESMDIYVIQYGEEECRPGHYFGPYVREKHILHYVYSGKGIFQVGGKTYHLTKGQAFLIFPNQLIFYKADEHEPWVYRWVEFGGKRIDTFLKCANLSEENPIYTEKEPYYAGEVLKNILDEGEMSIFKAIGWFYLFADALSYENKKSYTPQEEYVKKAVAYIKSHYIEKINIIELANFIGIDRSYLSRLFHQYEGVSIKRFIYNYRMEVSKIFLKNSSLSIGEISRSVGYPDPMDFSKAFKKAFGVSPTDWRKNNN